MVVDMYLRQRDARMSVLYEELIAVMDKKGPPKVTCPRYNVPRSSYGLPDTLCMV